MVVVVASWMPLYSWFVAAAVQAVGLLQRPVAAVGL